MSTPTFRVRFVYDTNPEHAFRQLEISDDEQKEHIVLECLVEKLCPCCHAWALEDTLCGIDFLRTDAEAEAFLWHMPHHRQMTPEAALALPGYLAEVAHQTLSSAGWKA